MTTNLENIAYKIMSERTGLNSTKREIIEDMSLSMCKTLFWKDRNVPLFHIFCDLSKGNGSIHSNKNLV